MVITREELDNYNYDELDLLSENLQKSSIISKEIAKIDESIKENDIELGKIDSLKDELVDKFNNAIDDAEKSKVVDEFKELKKKEEEILLKKEELEAKKEELEAQKNMLFDNEKEKVSVVNFFKEKANKIKDKLTIKKEEGFKLPKYRAKEYTDKEKEKVKLSERARNIFAKASERFNIAKEWAKEDLKQGVGYKVAETIKEKTPEIKEQIKEVPGKVKEWAKEDLKQGVGYKVAQTIKEKTPEIKESLHETRRKVGFRINRVTSAIARAPKNARAGLINTFNKVATWVNGKKEVIVSKTERFANVAKARVEATINRNEQLRQLKEDKKKLLEDYKKNVIGRYEADYRKAVEDEYQRAINGTAPARSL